MIDTIGTVPAVHAGDIIRAVLVAAAVIGVSSLVREPTRQTMHAIGVAAAAGAYMNGGFGQLELAFAVTCGFCAFRALRSYRWLGLGWLLHTGWDLAHHFAGAPMISWLPTSSMDCAVTDVILAVWFFAGAPDIRSLGRARRENGGHAA